MKRAVRLASDTDAYKGIELPRGEAAVDVIFQMGNGGLLAGNYMFHEVSDGDHSDYCVISEHRQMANVLVCHEAQTCFDSLAPMGCEHIG